MAGDRLSYFRRLVSRVFAEARGDQGSPGPQQADISTDLAVEEWKEALARRGDLWRRRERVFVFAVVAVGLMAINLIQVAPTESVRAWQPVLFWFYGPWVVLAVCTLASAADALFFLEMEELKERAIELEEKLGFDLVRRASTGFLAGAPGGTAMALVFAYGLLSLGALELYDIVFLRVAAEPESEILYTDVGWIRAAPFGVGATIFFLSMLVDDLSPWLARKARGHRPDSSAVDGSTSEQEPTKEPAE